MNIYIYICIYYCDNPITNFPSWVIQAWVTIAPKGLSASFEINLPVCKSQIPTQSLVTMAAILHSSAKLWIDEKEISIKNKVDLYQVSDKIQYTLSYQFVTRVCLLREPAQRYCLYSKLLRFCRYSMLPRCSNFQQSMLLTE